VGFRNVGGVKEKVLDMEVQGLTRRGWLPLSALYIQLEGDDRSAINPTSSLFTPYPFIYLNPPTPANILTDPLKTT